ncbi:MAG: amidohydrolase family protein [Candidatus Hodarchaeota archaeon]
MTSPKQLFSRFALIGPDLRLEENVCVTIEYGKIAKIEINAAKSNIEKEYTFPHHLLLPKFINSHTHIGDAALKDQAFEMSLNQAVGTAGHKYQIKNLTKNQRIMAMRLSMIEMIENGISAFYDFREDGLSGIRELKKAATNLPIELHILGRPNKTTDLDSILDNCDGLGLATPLILSKEDMIQTRKIISLRKAVIATHIGEEPQVIEEALAKYGLSDLQLALKYLDPNILIHLTVLKEKDLKDIPSSKFIVFCPRSNAYFGLGFPPVNYFLDKKQLVGLGTDNVMITPPNLLEELRWLILRLKEQKILVTPSQALRFITTNPSKALKLSTGCIKKGFWADLLMLDLKSCRTSFGKDPILTLLFRSHIQSDCDLNLFHGEIISNDFN